jgi:protein-L-isoaspartate(D-aspartate) O-methyltransferase
MGADPFVVARRNMVECQLVPGNVIEEDIVEALSNVPREQFVPEHMRGSAYVDEDLPVSKTRYLLAPLVLAQLLDLAKIKKTDSVLDVGCATGYSTAVLGQLAEKVVAVEEQMELAEKARQLLTRLHIPNAEIITGPLAPGYPSSGPYDVIFVNGAIAQLPDTLADQLAEGGRLVAVQCVALRPGDVSGLGKAVVYHKTAGSLFPRQAFDASVPLLHGFEEKRQFEF